MTTLQEDATIITDSTDMLSLIILITYGTLLTVEVRFSKESRIVVSQKCTEVRKILIIYNPIRQIMDGKGRRRTPPHTHTH